MERQRAVSAIEPTFLKSNILDAVRMGEGRIDDDEPWRTAWHDAMKRRVGLGPSPDRVARCVLHILESRRPRFLYVVGSELRIARWAKLWLPEKLFYWGLRKALRVKAR